MTDGDARVDKGAGFTGGHRLSHKASVVFAGNALGAFLGYLALIAIGRYYDPGSYGAYLFAVSLVGIANALFALGFDQAHIREVARGVPVSQALGVFVRIRAVLNSTKLVVIVAALWIWFRVLGRGFTDTTTLDVLAIIIASSVLVQIRKVATQTWAGQGRVHRNEWANALDSVVYAATIVLIGLGLGAANGRWTPLPDVGVVVAGLLRLPAGAGPLVLAKYVALGHFLGKVAGIGLAAFWWWRDRTYVGTWDRHLALDYRRFALPVALASVLALVLQHTDILMLGFFWTKTEVGWYGAAQRLANVALLANIALRGLLMPYFASLFSRGEGERAMRAFRQVERLLLMAVIPAALAMMVWADAGLHIFVGDPFLDAAPALRWLAAWTLIAALNMPLRSKHMGAGETNVIVGASVVNVCANIVLNVALIPTSLLGVPLAGLGAQGAAMATFFSALVAYGWNRLAARKLYGIPLVDRAQLRMTATAVVPALAWIWMHSTLPASAYDRFWELGAIGMAGLAIYGISLWVGGGLRRDDLLLLRRVMHPGELLREARGKG